MYPDKEAHLEIENHRQEKGKEMISYDFRLSVWQLFLLGYL